jgi:hypothetical protein
MNPATIILAQDLATALSGAFNAGYFARYLLRGYWLRASERRAKRTGSFALVLLGAAALAEAAFSQGLFAAGDLPTGIWALARLPLLLATAFITTIILRRVLAR